MRALQHDGDAGVTHGRTPVERSAHRAPSEARPSHVVRAEQVGRGGPAGMGGCGSGILGGLLGRSSAKFESTWRDTISVLIARGRAQVGVHSAKSDWSRRILDFAYMDYDDQAAHHE